MQITARAYRPRRRAEVFVPASVGTHGGNSSRGGNMSRNSTAIASAPADLGQVTCLWISGEIRGRGPRRSAGRSRCATMAASFRVAIGRRHGATCITITTGTMAVKPNSTMALCCVVNITRSSTRNAGRQRSNAADQQSKNPTEPSSTFYKNMLGWHSRDRSSPRPLPGRGCARCSL